MPDRTPKPPPLPIAPTRVLEEQRELKARQSDHEIKVSDDMRAMMAYAKKREAFEEDLGRGLVVVAGELGVRERLPSKIKSLAPPPAKDTPTTVHENALASAKAAPRTSAVLVLQIVLVALQLVIEVLHRL